MYGRMLGMKVSVSIPGEDVAFLDEYASVHAYPSRSAVVHRAIEMLRAEELSGAYSDAWEEWAASGEASRWDAVAGDAI
jgi:Arc/MetJ-type ribon-helix-helix transcriptional regulator